MQEKSLLFFPRSHNHNLYSMRKSIWDTNYARWKAHTLCSLRLTPSNSTTQNLEFSPLGTLGMITPIITHNALTFPHRNRTTSEQTKATEECQWSRIGGCKSNHCGSLQSHDCVVAAKPSAQKQRLVLGTAPQCWELLQLLTITPRKAFGVWTFVPHELVL